MSNDQGFQTRAIHVGQEPDATTGATIPPLYLTSTYTQPQLGHHLGYEYGRNDNPTRQSLEQALASLEMGRSAVSFASGMAASDAIVRLLKPGSKILAAEDLYGGMYRLLERLYRPQGMQIRYVDTRTAGAIPEALKSDPPHLFWIETPSNPLLNLIDIQDVAHAAHQVGALLVVDNTFASPYNQNPLQLGADIVVHSTTKYIGGHSDVIGGAVITNDEDWAKELQFIRNSAGATLGPFEAWLTLRGLKTLGLRMERHAHNARRVAELLQDHPAVAQVYYPGFESSIAARQMRTSGGMVSFTVRPYHDEPPIETTRQVLNRFRLFSLAESLGGVESLVGHPATMTHASVPVDERLRRGVTDNLIRLSVGVEDIDDILADIDQALNGRVRE